MYRIVSGCCRRDVFSMAAVEAEARRQVAGVLGDGFDHLWRNIIFHSFEMLGSEQAFMIYPRDAESMKIDTGVLPPGEFRLPRRDSE